MAGNFSYPVVLKKAREGGLVVSFPDVPEALTQGEDEPEALAVLKLDVYQAMRDAGVKKAELARRLNWHLVAAQSGAYLTQRRVLAEDSHQQRNVQPS